MNIDGDKALARSDRRVTLLFMLIAAMVFGGFAYLGERERGLIVACSFGVAATAAYVRWDARRRLCLWIPIVIILSCNLAFSFAFDVPKISLPVFTVVPIFIAETLLSLGMTSLCEWRSQRKK